MYDVALSVLSCVRADTQVHVAWVVDGADVDGAVALTPGGGRMGSLLHGAFDHALAEALPGIGETGGVVRLTVGPAESLMSGLTEGQTISVAILPGGALPEETWESLAARRAVSFAFPLDGTRLGAVEAGDPDERGVTLGEDRLTCGFFPVPRAVVFGAGPIVEALAEAFSLAGWQPSVVSDIGNIEGVMTTLSRSDAAVVLGHDVEISGRALLAAIASRAGYIGSIGSTRMQDLRQQWLAYRDVAWDERVHGPAGLTIGASAPGEIAISIVAEALSTLRGVEEHGV